MARAREIPADLAEFYPRAYRRLVGSLRLMGVPRDDAVEVAGEAFARLIPRWEQVRSYDQPDAWLRMVAWRHWLNRSAKERRLVLVPEQADVARPSDEESDSARRLTLHTALAALGDGQREVVVLHYLHDLPVARIASELGVAEGTVKSRLSRARAALAAALPEEVADDA